MGDITTAIFTTLNGDFIVSLAEYLTIDPNGFLHADTTNMYVGSFTQAVHITDTEVKAVGSAITFTGNLTGDVTSTGDVLMTQMISLKALIIYITQMQECRLNLVQQVVISSH